MRKFISLTAALLVLIFLVGCGKTPDEPIAAPSPDTNVNTPPVQQEDPVPDPQPEDDTEDPAPVDPPEDVPSEPRQEGTRLDSTQLAYYTDLFSLNGNDPLTLNDGNYYNLALSSSFTSPQELSLNRFFSLGFSNEWSDPITDAERDFFAKANGYDEFPLDMQRLPKELVEYVLEYYFCEDVDTSVLVYNPDTQCYYVGESGNYAYPNLSFTDGYIDESTGLVFLYYTHRATDEEYIVTIQSKASVGEAGYYIISNLPAV